MSTVHFPQMKKICAFESGTMDFSVLLWYIYNIFKGQTMTFICNIFPPGHYTIYTISAIDIHNYFITKEGVSKHLWTKENLKTNDF